MADVLDKWPPPWPLHEKFDDLLQSVYRLTDRILKLEMAANPHHDMVVAAPVTSDLALQVSRQEYDELFLAITRLTDRIEALESMVGSYDINRMYFPADTHQGRRK